MSLAPRAGGGGGGGGGGGFALGYNNEASHALQRLNLFTSMTSCMQYNTPWGYGDSRILLKLKLRTANTASS